MLSFILHSNDCTEQVQNLKMSARLSLPPTPDGYTWTEVPYPPEKYRAAIVDGDYEAVEQVEDPLILLEQAKRSKQDEVNALRLQLTDSTDTSFGHVKTDEPSRSTINAYVGLATAAKQTGGTFEIRLRLADDTYADLDADKIIHLGMEVGSYVNAVFNHSFALKDEIASAPTEEALSSIDITTGWPSTPAPPAAHLTD